MESIIRDINLAEWGGEGIDWRKKKLRPAQDIGEGVQRDKAFCR